MKQQDTLIHALGRFAVGLGIGLALTSAYVIVTSPDLLATKPAPDEIVRLDPVEVTISAERFAELHAELDPATRHVFGRGPQTV